MYAAEHYMNSFFDPNHDEYKNDDEFEMSLSGSVEIFQLRYSLCYKLFKYCYVASIFYRFKRPNVFIMKSLIAIAV